MAKFSQTFLQGLLQPSYQEGLFTAARGIGTAPGLQRQQQQQQEEMQKLRGMGAVERAEFMAGKAKTPEELMQAEAAKDTAMRQSALTSLKGLEAARQAAGTTEEKLRIENIMARVAVQAGVDPSTITGRTQAEQDDEISRELAQGRLKDQQRQEQEAAISQAYYNVPEGSLKKFEENAARSGFGNVIDELKEDKARDDLFQLEFKNAKTKAEENAAMKKAPLPVTLLRDRITNANIDPTLKEQFLSELDDIKQPNFEAKETWNPGERKQAMDSLESLNIAVRAEVSREVTRKNAIRADIRTLEKQKTKPPTKAQIDEQMTQAQENVVTTGFFGRTVEDDPEAVRKEATRLARITRDSQINDLLEQRRAELGGEAIAQPDETEEEEEGTELTTKADEIVGL
jgi:hypothetical protein